ncbi:hypothetical protein AB0I85_30420 [Micromonospora echinofusca]|uniref:hypothetical protein n=1 Tax=Micromonospora echinofusca TaxID=47858 RepID=UPI00340429F3
MARPDATPGTIVIYTDVACGWSAIAIVRLLRARAEAGLDNRVHLAHRLFLLEDLNRFPISGLPRGERKARARPVEEETPEGRAAAGNAVATRRSA